MSGRYLTDLADVCRSTGLQVYEQDGWQTRARSSGGFSSGRPTHIMCHHTASGPSADGWPDANYCSYSSDIRPVCNLYLDRVGSVYVLAAGCTNTNGSGHDSCGIAADDAMNTHAIGIEAGNDGVGESWPDAQQNAFITLTAALGQHYGINSAVQTHSHFEWAPSRKIDPAGPSRFGTINSSGTWNMDSFRAEVANQGAPVPTPPPFVPGTGGVSMWFVRSDLTQEFWIVAVDWEGQWAAPLDEVPQYQWVLLGPIFDIVNGPMVTVPHAYLQAIYDQRGRPATP